MLALSYDWWNIFVRLADPNLRSRSDNQPAVVPVGDRDTNAPCAPDHDPPHQLSRQRQTPRAKPAPRARRRPLPARHGEKCGAVDPPAKMARHPLARLPRLPQRSPDPPPATPRAAPMQPKADRHHPTQTPTAVSGVNVRALSRSTANCRVARS